MKKQSEYTTDDEEVMPYQKNDGPCSGFIQYSHNAALLQQADSPLQH